MHASAEFRPGISCRHSGVNFVPVGVFAVSGGDEVNERTGSLWQDCCLWIDGIDIKLRPFIFRQNRLQQPVIDRVIVKEIRQACDAKTGNSGFPQHIAIAG